jgi:hypothetical protein
VGLKSKGDLIMIYEKLSNIQEELFVPKDQKNNFGGYNYRSCEDILKTVKPLCKKYKCVLIMDSQVVTEDGKTHIVATALLHDLEDGTEIKSTAGAREEETKKGMDGSQISGASLSYARKYALAGLFCIDNEKDSDATNTTTQDEKIMMEGRESMIAFLEKNMPEERKKKMLEAYHISEIKFMKQADLTKVYAKIKAGE